MYVPATTQSDLWAIAERRPRMRGAHPHSLVRTPTKNVIPRGCAEPLKDCSDDAVREAPSDFFIPDKGKNIGWRFAPTF